MIATALIIVTLAAAPKAEKAEEKTPAIPGTEEATREVEAKQTEAAKPVEVAAAVDAGVAEKVEHAEKHTDKAAVEGVVVEKGPVAPKRVEPPPALTQGALAQELRKSAREQKAARSKLDDERKAIDEERAKLEALKKEIETSRAALRAETERLEGILPQTAPSSAPPRPVGTKATANAATQVKALAKTLKGIKPEQAAVIIARLDRTLAAQILHEMKPADAGAVLEKLKPDLAAELVSTLAATPAGPKELL